jgi:hypothetical protein
MPRSLHSRFNPLSTSAPNGRCTFSPASPDRRLPCRRLSRRLTVEFVVGPSGHLCWLLGRMGCIRSSAASSVLSNNSGWSFSVSTKYASWSLSGSKNHSEVSKLVRNISFFIATSFRVPSQVLLYKPSCLSIDLPAWVESGPNRRTGEPGAGRNWP